MKAIKWIIFDWDGTLMDSIALIVSSVQNAAIDVGIEMPSEHAAKSIIGMSLPKAIACLFPNVAVEHHQQIIEQYKTQYLIKNKTPSPMFEDAEFVLQQLKQAGYKLAVATGKARAGLNRVLTHTELAHYFDDTICADESESKPAPDMLNTLLQRNHISVAEAIMVGDTIHDLAMANNAGIASIGVTMGVNNRAELIGYKPVAIIDNLTEILSVLNIEAV